MVSPGLTSLVIQTQVFFTIGLSIAFNRERVAPFQQAGAPAIEFVLSEPRHGLEKIHLLIGHLERTRFERGDHAGEAELAEGAFEFRDRHGHARWPRREWGWRWR